MGRSGLEVILENEIREYSHSNKAMLERDVHQKRCAWSEEMCMVRRDVHGQRISQPYKRHIGRERVESRVE